MERTLSLLPELFGALQGVRILSTGTKISQPYAAHLAADYGAEVIQIEQTGKGDPHRSQDYLINGVNTHWIQDRRNSFCITLNLTTPEGRAIFLEKLIPNCDIWMENSKPGTYPGWGITDESVFRKNPKIVIAHVSGFGQTGDPDYVGRESSSLVSQAFGGLMYTTGEAEYTPIAAPAYIGDKVTALFTLWSSLSGYISAQRTGKGQAIDISEFESIHKITSGTMPMWFLNNVIRERSGNKAGAFQPYDAFEAKDGWLVIGAISLPIFLRSLQVIGLDPSDAQWTNAFSEPNSRDGLAYDAALRQWVSERSVDEVVRVMNQSTVPCGPVTDVKMGAEDPHFQARGIHEEWSDPQVGKVKGVRPVPWFSETPGKVWRGSVPVGHDNQLVYTKLAGLSQEEIRSLNHKGVI